jgi:hypothetical protein
MNDLSPLIVSAVRLLPGDLREQESDHGEILIELVRQIRRLIDFTQTKRAKTAYWVHQHARIEGIVAPGPGSVLEVLIERFRPMSWSGSRAALMEANARLLDSLESLFPSSLMPFLTEARAKFSEEVALERQGETRRDRARDERFE